MLLGFLEWDSGAFLQIVLEDTPFFRYQSLRIRELFVAALADPHTGRPLRERIIEWWRDLWYAQTF